VTIAEHAEGHGEHAALACCHGVLNVTKSDGWRLNEVVDTTQIPATLRALLANTESSLIPEVRQRPEPDWHP